MVADRYGGPMPSSHLVIIGDRDALSWVLTAQQMAFPAGRAKLAATVQEGDEVFVYTTRGCFGNPTRDLGRIVACGAVTSPVRTLAEPVRFGERAFTEGFRLRIDGLTPFREGLVLRDLVPRLQVFPDPATWSVRLRRPALALPPSYAELVRRGIEPLLRPYEETVGDYRR